MANRSEVLNFIVAEYFGGDIDQAAKLSGYTKTKIKSWCNGEPIPQKGTIQYFLHLAIVPEFTIIAEYEEFNPE